MKPTSDPQASLPGNDASVEEIQASIDDTRGEVAATVAQLSWKFDLTSRTQHTLHDIKQSALDTAHLTQARGATLFTRLTHGTTGTSGPSRKSAAVGAAITIAAIAAAVVGLRRRQR
jgi:hypothetical protein